MLKGTNLVGGVSAYEKPDHDFYATDPATVRIFFNALKKQGFDFESQRWWEPACGDGNICRVIREYAGYDAIVDASDIVDRGWRDNFKQSNFFDLCYDDVRHHDVIITNPPFSHLNGFIDHGLRMTERYLMLFCKIQALETVERARMLKAAPLQAVYVHSRRQPTWRNGKPFKSDGSKWATTMCMAWLVFDKEYKGEPVLRFL